jgi:Uncharacterized protein conserved in bacteria
MILNDKSPMPYGKYKGQAMCNVPADYLLWLYEERKFNREVRIYIEDNLQALKAEVKKKRY